MIAIVVGTRPEIIKMSPLISYCSQKGIDYFLIHTNQHYSYELDEIFFKDLGIKNADFNLHVGSGSHGEQTSKIIERTEKLFKDEKPDFVLVQGDTNTVFGSAFSASRLGIPVGHVEAGLRSRDMSMPEEVNRILTDHISNYLFAPTPISKNNLEDEKVTGKIVITGNTIVDATLRNMQIAEKKSDVMERNSLQPDNFILATFHRQENVDNKKKLEKIMESVEMIYDQFNIPIFIPLHPRTSKMLETFGFEGRLKTMSGVTLSKPLGYLDFLVLERNARILITDSGGVQEEACILGRPCITIRENTERPETVDVGSNIIAGTEPKDIIRAVSDSIEKRGKWKNPFGDGKASKRIIKSILHD